MTDLDPMTFGMYKGIPMQEVPVTYLHWAWHKCERNDKTKDVLDYINKNLTALKDENDDLIWSK